MAIDSNQQKSVAAMYLRELRDVEIQKDMRRFEHNLERLGFIAGYEISKSLNYKSGSVKTPLGEALLEVVSDKIVIATILRAGLPMQRGLAQVFDDAELAFIAAGRKPETENGVEIDLAYTATPDLEGKVLIIADTMLATGQSIVDAYTELLKHGKPSRTFVAVAIGSQPGVDFVESHMPEAEVFAAAVDPELNDKYFIVPGLGDAGDLLYGKKL